MPVIRVKPSVTQLYKWKLHFIGTGKSRSRGPADDDEDVIQDLT